VAGRFLIDHVLMPLAQPVSEGARVYLHAATVLGGESHGGFVDWEVRP
jgi:hypothetical protein